jgi:hypothetical protein
MRQSRALAQSQIDNGAIRILGAPVEVRRHPGARRLTLRVSRTRRAVIVTLPLQCDLDEAGSFLDRNIAWVRERLDSLPRLVPFAHNVFLPLRGEPHRIVFTGVRGMVVERVEGGEFPELHVSGATEHAPRRLADWLSKEAQRDLEEKVGGHARTLAVHPKKVAVRDQLSRWGSCSTTGVLSFSWRLVLAPPGVLDYVAAHEVAHLKEMNHGPRFWTLVRRLNPGMEHAKRWLQIYGMDLHRYGGSLKRR